MSDVLNGRNHYMAFYHPSSGLVRGDFEFTLLADGELRQDISVNVREPKPYYYVAWFENDGTDHTNWVLFAKDPNFDYVYVESWRARRAIAEKNIKELRHAVNSQSGFSSFRRDQEEE